MYIQVIIQDNKGGQIFDISHLVTDIQWQTTLEDQPGKLNFTFMDDKKAIIIEGATISVKVNDQGLFFGYVFKYAKTKEEKIQVTAYDQMRYLKNKDTFILTELSASQIFSKVCTDFNLTHTVKTPSSYIISPRIHDNKTLFEIIQYGIDETLIKTGNWFIMRDNFGTLEFIDINELKTDLFIGDKKLLLNYAFESSIDDDTYNQIKLVKESKESEKREVYVVKDSQTIGEWGLLQYFEQMDENANPQQIQERAEMLLTLKNRVTKKLTLNCLGNLGVFAGVGIILSVEELVSSNISINEYFMVTSCTHIFKNDLHIMQLELRVSI